MTFVCFSTEPNVYKDLDTILLKKKRVGYIATSRTVLMELASYEKNPLSNELFIAFSRYGYELILSPRINGSIFIIRSYSKFAVNVLVVENFHVC